MPFPGGSASPEPKRSGRTKWQPRSDAITNSEYKRKAERPLGPDTKRGERDTENAIGASTDPHCGYGPPPNQTIKEKQDAVRAVASLGLGGPPPPTRWSESFSEQDSGQMKSLAPHRIQLMASHESLQGHQMRSSETPMKNCTCSTEGPVKHGQMACNESRTEETVTGKAARTRRTALDNNASSTSSTDMRLIHNPPTASIIGAPGLQGEKHVMKQACVDKGPMG
ncbi:hypothetical protein NDU88_004382 [Pleurodeles waltl]|uniref:Prolactin receptor n=1 Tax=Pleurodeles waltl TaxID=8319 RepID=A0AAV7VKK1_PLEWA|nr:hypothetical protein NDU88_004382 [Pleurodeles waltl]